MPGLVGLLAALLIVQLVCLRQARRKVEHMMRPGEHWDGEDIDRWLALIETFPLGDEAQQR